MDLAVSQGLQFPEPSPADSHQEAALLLAVADGLMFDAITSPQSFDANSTAGLLDLYLQRLLVG